MEENKNTIPGQNGLQQDSPRTYGEESRMYAEQGYKNQPQQPIGPGGANYGQSNYDRPNYERPNYGQPNYNQQQPMNGSSGSDYGQSNYNQAQSMGNFGQPNYSQPQYNGGVPPQQPGSGPNYSQPQYNGGMPPQQPGYGQPYGMGGNMNQQPAHGPVTNVFCYILLVLMPLRIVLSFFMTQEIFGSMNYRNLEDGSYIFDMLQGGYMTMAAFGNLVFVAVLVMTIIDIVMVYRGNYKITGLILFALFLNPGYYLWRSHILGQKKTVPIVYTVAYVLLYLSYFVFAFVKIYQMIMEMMHVMV